MAPPSKNFTIIADSAIDADSPITADLMEDFRDNDIHLEEWLGKNYTAAVDHDHDGVNSAVIALSAYQEELYVVVGSDWSVSSSSLGITPQVAMIGWAGNVGGVVGGIGWSIGVGEDLATAWYDNGSSTNAMRICSDNHFIGYGTGTSAFTEYGDTTAFSSSGITIASGSGAWSAGALYINLTVWGV